MGDGKYYYKYYVQTVNVNQTYLPIFLIIVFYQQLIAIWLYFLVSIKGALNSKIFFAWMNVQFLNNNNDY